MPLQRLFTLSDHDAFETVAFRWRKAVQPDAWDDTDAELPDVELPESWSGLTAAAFARLAMAETDIPAIVRQVPEDGVPAWLLPMVPDVEAMAEMDENERYGGERSARQVFDRVAGALTYAGWKQGYFADSAEAATFCDEFRYLLATRALVLSDEAMRQIGLKWAYGIGTHDITLTPDEQADVRTLTDESVNALAYEVMSKQVQTGVQSLGLSILQKIPDISRRDPEFGQVLVEYPFELEARKEMVTGALAGRPSETVRKKLHHVLHHASGLRLLFDDAMRQWTGIPAESAAVSIQLDLLRLRDDAGALDVLGLDHATRIATFAGNMMIDMAKVPGDVLQRHLQSVRPLAIQIGNLHPFLLAQALPFDDPAGHATASSIAALVTGRAYATSAEIAGLLSPFEQFTHGRDAMLRVLRNQRLAVFGGGDYESLSSAPQPIVNNDCPDRALIAQTRDTWNEALALGHTHGFRNVSVTSMPVSLMPDDDLVTGAVPLQRYVMTDISGNGELTRRLHPSVTEALQIIGYSADDITDMATDMLGHRTLRYAPGVNHAVLMERGFDQKHIERMEAALPYTEDLRAVFSPWVLGEEWSDDNLFDVLSSLGFKEADVAAAQTYCYGTGKMPFTRLKPEHHKVFANASPEALIRMAGTIQTFISDSVACQITSQVHIDQVAFDQMLILAEEKGLRSLMVEQVQDAIPPFVKEAMRWIEIRSTAAEEQPTQPLSPFNQATRYLRAKSRRLPGGPREAARLKVRISEMQGVLPLSDKLN